MSPFETLLLAGLAVAALVNATNPRGLLWLAAGAADYIFTSWWYHAGLPAHPFAVACTDASLCVAIYVVAHRRGGHTWELPLFSVFQFSVLVSITRLLEISDAYQYALLLELVNWAALLIIGGTEAMRLADVATDRDSNGHLHRTVRALYAPADLDPWWWARRLFPKR